MLKRLLCSHSPKREAGALSAPEEAEVARLAQASLQLLAEEDHLDTQSEQGLAACASFLELLERASIALGVEQAPRSYRAGFTINYRALFPDGARSYRVDVLEASAEQYHVIWVNGDKFEFSPEAMRRAEALQRAWNELRHLLDSFHQACMRGSSWLRRRELSKALYGLDAAWAGFEEKYIRELIDIEEQARRLIVEAVEREARLTRLEGRYQGEGDEALQRLPEYRQLQRQLVACITQVNAVANSRRKGRDDITEAVLSDAIRILCQCEAAERSGEGCPALAAAGVLAADVVESFAAMRCYLREVQGCIERVDPHLCNNSGLVERLVDWEESWELGARYVQRPEVLAAVCDLVAEVQAAFSLVPRLAMLCENCEAELFMVLPRLAWLRFLFRPEALRELLRDLLPHHFPQKELGEEVLALLGRSEKARKDLQVGGDREQWGLLVQRVVSGREGPEPPSVRSLVRELEKWSMELQRHHPEDWNQCSAILVRCLAGGEVRPRLKEAPFRV